MNNKKNYSFKHGLLLLLMAIAILFYFNVSAKLVYGALPELREISEEEYYGRDVLSKMENAEKYLYIYDQMVEGLGKAQSSINVYDGVNPVTLDDLSNVYETVINDYPQYFWIDNGFSYSYNSISIISFSPNYYELATDLEGAKEKFEVGIEEIIDGIDASMSEFERELLVHDRLANKVVYDMEADNAHSAYGSVVDGKAVCDGYSRAFQYAMYKLGIQCQTVTGTSDGGGHAWNLIRIDGKYYYVDLTWNDKSESTQIYYSYFNLPLSQMEDHILDVFIELPECNSWDANYFTIFGGRIESPSVEVFVSLMNDDMNGRFYITGDNSTVWEWFKVNRTEIAGKIGINSSYSSGYRRMGKEWNLYFINCTRDEIPVTSVSVNKDLYEFTEEGDSFTISATVTPSDARNQKVYYSTSNKDVAIVNKFTGLVTCVGEGTADIIATSEDGELTAICKVVLKDKEPLQATLKADGSTEALTKTVGSKVKLDVEATGGSEEYTYKFAVYNNSTKKWSVLQNFSENSSFTCLISSEGTKQFAVTVKDSEGNTVATNRISVKAILPLTGKLTVNGSNSKLTMVKGSKITLDALAKGGTGKYTYKFAVMNVSTKKWSVLKDFNENKSYTYSLNYKGTKQFAVTVKDSEGNTVATNRITVNVIDNKALAGKLTADGSMSDVKKAKGSEITLKAIGEGGTGSYTYKFAVLNVNTGKWSVLRDFDSNDSITYLLKYSGTKQFAVTVKDSQGNTVATNRITVEVAK